MGCSLVFSLRPPEGVAAASQSASGLRGTGVSRVFFWGGLDFSVCVCVPFLFFCSSTDSFALILDFNDFSFYCLYFLFFH